MLVSMVCLAFCVKLMDTVGNKGAHTEIQSIKIATPAMATWVIDKAIQVHGASDRALTRMDHPELCVGSQLVQSYLLARSRQARS